MFKVEYGYYNYPKKIRYFKTHESAKKYFYYIGKQNGVKKVELTTMEHANDQSKATGDRSCNRPYWS